jgi:hypothetical protein
MTDVIRDRMWQRRDSAANWASINPTLGPGELGVESDGSLAKMGDGATRWNDLPYWISSGETDADAAFLSKSANLSDLSSASSARSNLGLGTGATSDSSDFDPAGSAAAAQSAAEAASMPLSGGAFTGRVAPKVQALSQSGGHVAVDGSLGNVFTLTLTASGWQIDNPSNLVDGSDYTFRLKQDSSGGRSITWGSQYSFGDAGTPSFNTVGNKLNIVKFQWVAADSIMACLSSRTGLP